MTEALEERRKNLSQGVVRLLLVHEATHAWDYDHHPHVLEPLPGTPDEQRKVLWAVSEGHAQIVAELVAEQWGARREWQEYMEYARDLDGVPRMKFPYVDGHEFFRAVRTARGSDGVRAVLATPPLGEAEIRDPALYLRRTAPQATPSVPR